MEEHQQDAQAQEQEAHRDKQGGKTGDTAKGCDTDKQYARFEPFDKGTQEYYIKKGFEGVDMENKEFEEWYEQNNMWLIKKRCETQFGFEDSRGG